MNGAGVDAHVVLPDGLPTPESMEEQSDIAALAESQLADTRKAAENWRTGLAGLLTLIAATLVIKGKSSFEDFDSTARWVLSFVTLGALASAAVGTWYALKAAYGKPRTIQTDEIIRMGGVDVWKQRLAARTVSDLRWARLAAYGALTLVTAAVVTTWVANPPPKMPAAFIRVKQQGSESPICGELQRFNAGTVTVKVDSEQSKQVPTSNLESISVVASCNDS
jgi:hypothetical protein